MSAVNFAKSKVYVIIHKKLSGSYISSYHTLKIKNLNNFLVSAENYGRKNGLCVVRVGGYTTFGRLHSCFGVQ